MRWTWPRVLWGVGALLFVTMVVHVVALVVTGGPLTGPVSLRKPATFAETGWLLAWSVALLMPVLRMRRWQRHVVGGAIVLFGVGEHGGLPRPGSRDGRTGAAVDPAHDDGRRPRPAPCHRRARADAARGARRPARSDRIAAPAADHGDAVAAVLGAQAILLTHALSQLPLDALPPLALGTLGLCAGALLAAYAAVGVALRQIPASGTLVG